MKNLWKSLVWRGALIVLLTTVAYLPVFHAGFIWDDDAYVTDNVTLRSLHGLWRIWFQVGAVPQYYPLVHTSFWLEYHLWGLNPSGYHIINVILHALAAFLLWRVLMQLQIRQAWVPTVLFALHPVCVESVAWVTERKNVLSAVFYFAAALAYLRYVGLAEGGGSRRRGWWYGSALVLFVAALLSKTVTCSLPVALLLVLWWKQGRLERKDVLPLTPFFLIGTGLGLMTTWIEKHHLGAQGADWSLTLVERCLIAGRALWFYVGKLLWPVQLTFIYPHWNICAAVWWQWLFPASAVGVVVALWVARRRIGRGPLASVLFFAVTLFPALGFVNVYPMRYSFVADHFQYLACVGLIVLGAAGLSRLPRVVSVMLVVVLGALTWQQCHVYRDPETLWRDTIAKNPGSWMAHNNLGLGLFNAGDVEGAMAEYRASLQIKNDHVEAYNNLGYALASQGRLAEAIAEYQTALRIHSGSVEVRNNLGNALAGQGRFAEAVAEFREALRIEPDYVQAIYNMANTLVSQERISEAIAAYEAALRIDPDLAEVRNNLGSVLASQGRFAEATAEYQAALRINPNLAAVHNNLGRLLADQGRIAEAMEHFEQALRIQPDYAEAHYNLGLILERAGMLKEAIGHYEQALLIKPDYAEARNRLARFRAVQ
jgi:Tfp pilus assembly protein PilF